MGILRYTAKRCCVVAIVVVIVVVDDVCFFCLAEPPQAKTGTRLTELSVCDVALRNLVRPTELNELAEVSVL